MFPIQQHRSIREDQCDIRHGVLETDAFMRTASEDEVVAWVGVGASIFVQPPLRQELVGLWVDLGIVERVVERRNNHAVCGDSVVIGDRERLGGLVGNLKAKCE